MSDIDIGVLNAKVVSFADDTQLYSKISYVKDCDSLQSDLNCVYDWAKTNNMVFNSQKFKYLSFSTNVSITSDYVNAYVNQNFYVIDNVNNLKDLGIIMSSYCSFEQHITGYKTDHRAVLAFMDQCTSGDTGPYRSALVRIY